MKVKETGEMIAGVIFKAAERPYDEDCPEYDCYRPCDYVSPENMIGDCWVCDKNGNVAPGYFECGVPVHRDNLGEEVKI